MTFKRMGWKVAVPTLSLCFLAIWPSEAQAEDILPTTLVYQGRLTDGSGTPLGQEVSVVHQVRFRFFETAEPGLADDPICTWTQFQVNVSDGLFRVEIGNPDQGNGSCTNMQQELAQRGSLWMEMGIWDGQTQEYDILKPLSRIGAAARAHHAQYCEQAAHAAECGGLTAEIGCGPGQLLKMKEAGDGWGCAPDLGLLGGMTCANDQLLRFDGFAWECGDDQVLDEEVVDEMVEDNGYAKTAELATVALSGQFVDLEGVPEPDYSNAIPPGAILMFNKSCPQGWVRIAALDDRFPMGASEYGEMGGSDSHVHGEGSLSTPAHAHSFSDTVSSMTTSDGNHSHTVDSHSHAVSGHAHSLNGHPHSLSTHTHGDGSLFAEIGTVGNMYLAFDSVSNMFTADKRAGTTWQEVTGEGCYGVDVAGTTGAGGGGNTAGPSSDQTGQSGAGSTGSSAPGTTSIGAHSHSLSDFTASGTTSSGGGGGVSGNTGSTNHLPPYLKVVFCLKQ